MLMYEMLTGLPPWYTKDRQKLFERLRGAPLTIPKNVSAPSASIIGGLLTRNPSKRLGTHGALQVCRTHLSRFHCVVFKKEQIVRWPGACGRCSIVVKSNHGL